MKKQTKSNIKAHLIRSSFYVLLLLAVCVIPFALAQRNTDKQPVKTPKHPAQKMAANRTSAIAPGRAPGSVIGAAQAQSRPAPRNHFSRAPGARRPGATITAPHGDCGIVINGGFETGDLPPWTDTGDTSFTGVDGNPHSGIDALFSGPSVSDGFIDQIIPTVDGQAYDVTFWLENDDASNSNRFGVSFGGITLVPEATQSSFPYTQFTFTNVVPGANADLQFVFFNPPSFFYLDDVCVVPSGGGTPTPTPTASPTCPPGSPNGAGAWTAAAPYPTTIVRYGFVQTATDFYVFGGVSDGSEVNNVNKYNIASGTWTPLSPMPFTSEAPTCALDTSTGIAYCAQGDTGNGFASYNTATDTWTPLAATPLSSDYGCASGAFNGKVFLAGSQFGDTVVSVYDVASDTWSPGTASPDNFFLAGYQQVGQFLYVVGGFNANTIPTNNATTWRLDMSSAPGTWETGPAFTQGRADFGLAYDAGTNKLYAMGGDLQGNGFFDSTSEVDELDVSGWPGGTWNPSPPDLPLPNRQANQAGFFGASQIWSVGGLDGATFIFNDEVWSRVNGGCPPPNCTPGQWQEVAAMPTDLYGAAGASDGTNFYAAGGYSFSQGITLNAANKYNPGTNGWTPLSPMPQSAALGCGVYDPANNKFYAFGGEDAASGTNYNVTQIYDIASDTWTMGANMPDVHSFMACGYVPATGMIYVLSGYNTGDVTSAQPTTWQYDPVGDAWTDLTAQDAYPHPAGGFAYGVINDKLYVSGGRDPNLNIINDTYEFDPQAAAGSRYTQKADQPGTFQNNVPGSAAAQNLLWVFGGGNPFVAGAEAKAGIAAPSLARITKPSSSIWGFVKRLFGGSHAPDTDNSGRFYDPSTDTWTASPNMNELRSFSTGAAIGDSLIIAAGGYNGASTVASAETENVCAGGGTPTPTPTVTPTPSGSCPPVLTESADQSIVSGNSVSCNNGVGHADNSYFRAFNMNTFVGGVAYDVTSVDFGIEQATSGTGTGQPVEVRLYANHGAAFPGGDWQSNMIADSGMINIPDQSLTIFNLPITVTVPAGTLELVYELFTPNGENVGNLFFVGSNPDGQTADSYLEAADCGVTVPTPTEDIGFPGMMIVFNVNGSCGATPTPTPTPTPGTPTPTPTPGTPTPTPTPATPTPTPSVTPTPIITPTPTPRQSPTPRPRPTPHPRPTPP